MTAAPQTAQRRPDHASDKLVENSERVLWAAHVRAAQLLDDEPGPVARDILNAVSERWRQAFLRTDHSP